MMQDEPELSQPPPAFHQDSWSKAELLDLITRSAGATMAVIDRSLVMIYVNEEYARWFGAVPQQLVGKTLVEVYGESDCARFMPFVERVLHGFITTALDVHELQVTMNALRAANQRLSSHMENSPLAVLEMDHNLRLLHCSQRAVQLMGWLQVAGLEGRLLTELVDPSLQDDGLQSALQRLQSGQSPRTARRPALCGRTVAK